MQKPQKKKNILLKYQTIDTNNEEPNIYNKKLNSPKQIFYADASKPVFDHSSNNIDSIKFISKYNNTNTNTNESSICKKSKKNNFDCLEMETQKEISLREEEIRLLKLEIKRLSKGKDEYYACLEQEKDKSKGYLEEIETLKRIKADLKVLTEKYDFLLTHEYREIVSKYDKSEQIRRDQENMISLLRKEMLQNEKSQNSQKHSRNPSRSFRLNTNANNMSKSEIKQQEEQEEQVKQEEIKGFIKTEENLNNDNYSDENEGNNKPLQSLESSAKKEKKKKAKSKIKKKTENDSKKTSSVNKNTGIKKIINNDSKTNSSHLSSLSSNVNRNGKKAVAEFKVKLKANKSLLKSETANGIGNKEINRNVSTITKKTSVSKIKKKN